MLRTLQTLPNGFLLANLDEGGCENSVSRDAMLSRHIRSFYLMADAIVSKVDKIEEEQKKVILVVDDESSTVQLIDEFLTDAHVKCEIVTAISGKKAYEIAISAIPDLIITDWLIPEIDGLELIQRLKANPVTRDIPVLMATGVMARSEEFEKVLKSGAFSYIRKPLDHAELKTHVKAALALNESLKEVRIQKDAIQLKDQFVNFLVDASPHPIFYQDKWGRFIGCNRSFEKLVNKNKKEFIGKVADQFLPQPLANLLEYYFLLLKECGVVQKFEFEMPWSEGASKHLVLSYVGCGRTSVEIVIGSITDITEIIQSGKETVSRLETIRKLEKEHFVNNVEKLQAELDFKQRELSLHLELLLHSRNVKEKLIEGVNKLQPFLTEDGKSKLYSILRSLHWELSEESSLDIEKKFDEMNSGLYSLLERSCPEITKNEKRLCAYLKMNHGASDIAKITDRSLNSVNVGFARLRAKLGLPNTKDLRSYLNELSLFAAF